MRLPGRGRRLGGGGAAHRGVEAARYGGSDPRAGGSRRRLRRDHGAGHGPAYQQRVAPGLDAGGRTRRDPDAAGVPHDRGSHRPTRRGRRAGGRLSDRRLGRRDPPLPRVHRGPRTRRRRRDARRAGEAPGRRRRGLGGEGPAIWTEDDAKSTRISPELAHYTGQEELSRAIDEAFATAPCRRRGHRDREVRDAVRIASAHGDTHKLHALAAMVEIVEASTGIVRPRVDVDELDRLALEAGSVKTNRLG